MSQDILYTFYQNLGNVILLKYRKNGKSYSKKIDFYKPSLFFTNGRTEQFEESGITTMFGQKVWQRQFESISACKDFVKGMKDVDGVQWFGNSDFASQFIIEMYKGQTPVFDPKEIRVGILDIEVHTKTFPEAAKAEKPINGITIHDSFTNKYYCLGNAEYVREHRLKSGLDIESMYVHDPEDKDVGSLDVEYTEYPDEETFIRGMLQHFKEFDYDLTSGWNSESFDMVYIVKRCYQIVGEEYTKAMLSPFKRISFREGVDKFGKEELKVDICGLPHVDYMDAYKKHMFDPRDSYRLDNIAFEELGEQKLDYEEEGSLYELHLNNPQKFFAYNIKDVKLIKQLDDKLGLFALTMTLAYYCGCNYEDTLATVKPWQLLIAKELYNTNRVPPYSSPRKDKQDFEGAFVKEVLPGMWKWLIAFDYNSLYPMLECQCNIGPETYVPRYLLPKDLQRYKSIYTVDDIVNKTADLSALKESGFSMTANFEFYRKDQVSTISSIKDKLYTGRTVYKKKMKEAQNLQESIKVEMKRRGLAL